MSRELSDLRSENARLKAEVDALSIDVTGAMSRRAGESVVDRLERELSRSTHSSVALEDQELDFAVVFVDLDGLKAVNDTVGHAQGDDLLARAASALLTAAARPTDYVIRWGGDEFVIIARTEGYPQEPGDLGAMLRDRVRASFKVAGVSASVGFAFTTFQVSLKDAIAGADECMYLDKSNRKNNPILDPMTGEEYMHA
jgi:diguanylate cyclase (GGDEF)-like protein